MATLVETEPDIGDINFCEAGHRGDGKTRATQWCQTCAEALCEVCCNYHRNSRYTSTHTIMSIEKVTEEERILRSLDMNFYCTNHQDKPLEMFCKGHGQLCCMMCALTTHKSCDQLYPIKDVADQFTVDNKLRIKLPDFTVAQDHLKKISNDVDKRRTETDKVKESLLANAHVVVNDVKGLLDSFYNDFKTKVENTTEARRHTLENTTEAVSKLLEEFHKNTKIAAAIHHICPRKAFILQHEMTKQTVSEFVKTSSMLDRDIGVNFTFQADSMVESLFKDLKSLGDIVETKGRVHSSNDMAAVKDVIDNLQSSLLTGTAAQVLVQTVDMMTKDVRHVNSITKKELNIGNVVFRDGAFLKDGHLLLADGTSDHNRLIMLSADLQCKKELKLARRPIGLCVDETTKEVYTACLDDNSVDCYSLKDEWRKIREFEARAGVYGVKSMDNSVIVGSRTTVEMYEKSGKKIRSVEKLGYIGYIAVTQDQQRYIHSDGNDIVCRCMDGSEDFRYTTQTLQKPSGICTDRHDNVYVVGYGSKNVHQISRDGSKGRVIIDRCKEIKTPWGIVFHPHRDLFVVTSWSGETKLEVYEFC